MSPIIWTKKKLFSMKYEILRGCVLKISIYLYLIWILFGSNVQSYCFNNGGHTKIYRRTKNFYKLHVRQIFACLSDSKG